MNRSLKACLAAALALALAVPAGQSLGKRKKKALEARTVEDLRIVDCLLPGQLHQLGRRSPYLTARRPIRTTAVDCEIRGGDYARYDRASYAASLEVWISAAAAGDPKAQTYVGEIFEKGPDGTPDHEEAVRWYRKAAEQGFSRAQTNLANLYEQGLGVPRDREKAVEWYRKAAGISAEIVLDSRAEAAALRRELEHLKEREARDRLEVDAAREDLEEARRQLDAARREVEELRRRLEEARQTSQAEVESLSAELRRRETDAARMADEIAQRDREMSRRQESLADLWKRIDETRDEVRNAAGDGPTIRFVRPDVLATRGPAIVPVAAGLDRLQIAGQVTPAEGLASFTVGGRPLDVDADGSFRTELSCSELPREVRFEAEDEQGRRAERTLVLQLPSEAAAPPSRDREPIGPAPEGSAGTYHALIISVSHYRQLNDLETAIADAEELERVLREKYAFETKVLKDPARLVIYAALTELKKRLRPEDHLLIYYAGHGRIEDEGERGYWLPADADGQDPGSWIPNETISDYLDVIEARHILVVSDSCYAGTLTLSGLGRLDPALPEEKRRQALRQIAGKRSRTVLTSGGLQPVLDVGGGVHSLFAGKLLAVLKNNDDRLPGDSLHQEVAFRVTVAARNLGVDQAPEYAPIRHAGHETGDFVLLPLPTRGSERRSVSR